MPHKRSIESAATRAPAATLAAAMTHVRRRESAVSFREVHVQRRESLAPELNLELLDLLIRIEDTVQMATNLAGHHLTDEHEEKANEVAISANKSTRHTCPAHEPVPVPPLSSDADRACVQSVCASTGRRWLPP